MTRRDARSVVLLSEEEYEGIRETLHLLRSPANAARLLGSTRTADAGELTERELAKPARNHLCRQKMKAGVLKDDDFC